MKSVSGWIVATCILALGLGAGAVSAATITETINFTASGFNAGAPVDPVIGFATSFEQTNLVSDLPGLAANQDPNLINPWGIAFNGGSPFWISDQGANVATLYSGAGVPQPTGQPLVVSTPLGPTGVVSNPDIIDGSFPLIKAGNPPTSVAR